MTTTPKPKQEPYEVGGLAGSATVTYETKPKPKEGVFEKLAAMAAARRAERPVGTLEQRRSAEAQKRRMEALEAGKGNEAELPEAEEPTAAAPVSAPATASVTPTTATKKKPATLQQIQRAAFQKTEEVGVA